MKEQKLREALEQLSQYNVCSCEGGDSYDPEMADYHVQKAREVLMEALATSKPEPVGINGLTYDEESATASVMGIVNRKPEPQTCEPCDNMGYIDGTGDVCTYCGGTGSKPEPQAKAGETESTWCWKERIQNARELYKVFSPDAVEQIVNEALAASKPEPPLLQKSFAELVDERKASKPEPQAHGKCLGFDVVLDPALEQYQMKMVNKPQAQAAEPVQWAPGPNTFKDWCAQWFGPDADDAYLAQAVHALPLMAIPPRSHRQERRSTGGVCGGHERSTRRYVQPQSPSTTQGKSFA